MKTSESITKLAAALLGAQKEFGVAKKVHTNPHYRSNYAGLAEVMEACKPSLDSHGIIVLQPAEFEDGKIAVTTMLIHAESGEWIQSTLLIATTKQDAQAYGSAITYGRRYGLSSMLGIIADDDDDGNAASNGNGHAKQNGRPVQPVNRIAPKNSPAYNAFRNVMLSRLKEHPDIWPDASTIWRHVLEKAKLRGFTEDSLKQEEDPEVFAWLTQAITVEDVVE